MKYHHIGIPTHSPKEGETYLKDYDVHCTDHESNPYGIQWMRYGNNCNLPKLVKEETPKIRKGYSCISTKYIHTKKKFIIYM